MKKILSLMAVFVVSLLALSMVSALDTTNLDWGTIKVNGNVVDNGDILAVEEGETLEIKIGLEAVSGATDIEVEAEISGYEYDDYESLDDSTHLFDLAANTTKYVNLEVQMPNKLDKDEYWLRLRIMDKNTAAVETVIRLAVEPTRHGVDIKDVAFSPGNTVKAGRSLLATVLLENFGDKTEKDVKVTVAIPTLGVSATEYVDVVDTDNNNIDYEDVPEMFLPIPATAAEGEYTVVVTVKYDDLRETVTESYILAVMGNELFQDSCEKLVLAIGPENQKVTAGKTATYAIALTNAGTCSKAYTLEAVTGSWGTVTLSDSLVVLESGKNQVVYLDVAVDAQTDAGAHVASVVVSAGNEMLETITVTANVVASEGNDNLSLRNGLEIALIVLVVLLVVIGLIIGFSRLRKDDEEEEQTYY
jgi:uncharacterized membrane protein